MSDMTVGRIEFGKAKGAPSFPAGTPRVCRCDEKDRRISELERENALLKAPEKISAKTLYQRLVGKLLQYWAELYPMVEWVDPEQSAAVMAREIMELRKDKSRMDRLAELTEGVQNVYIEPLGWIQLDRQSIDVALERSGEV